jgi:hypothetical protein
MAYDTIVTDTVNGTDIKDINTSVEVPVNNTRAFAETVITGLTQLINNDVTIQANMLDGYHGGSYIPKESILLIDDGDSRSEFKTGIPLRFITQSGQDSRGLIKNDIVALNLSGTVYSLGAIGTLKERYEIDTFYSGGTKEIKIYCPDNYTNFIGKEVVFYLKDPSFGIGVGDMLVYIYIYDNITDYNSHSKTNCTRQVIDFGNNQIFSVTFLMNNITGQLTFYPTSIISLSTIPTVIHQLWPVTL